MSALTDGVVLRWSGEHGWGVLRSEEVPGEVWAHFSAIRSRGYQTLEPGTRVRFSWEEAHQDGFAFRAVEVFPEGTPTQTSPPDPADASAAFQTSLVIEFDRDPPPHGPQHLA
jgi:cold shock protein